MKRATSLGALGAAGLRLFGERKTKVTACPMPARLSGKRGKRLRWQMHHRYRFEKSQVGRNELLMTGSEVSLNQQGLLPPSPLTFSPLTSRPPQICKSKDQCHGEDTALTLGRAAPHTLNRRWRSAPPRTHHLLPKHRGPAHSDLSSTLVPLRWGRQVSRESWLSWKCEATVKRPKGQLWELCPCSQDWHRASGPRWSWHTPGFPAQPPPYPHPRQDTCSKHSTFFIQEKREVTLYTKPGTQIHSDGRTGLPHWWNLGQQGSGDNLLHLSLHDSSLPGVALAHFPTLTQRRKAEHFPGGPVFRTPCSQCRGHGWSRVGELRSHRCGQKQKSNNV